MPPAPTIFVSYSHKDKSWKDRLLEHLGGLEEEGLLKIWCDQELEPGDDWFEEIREAMDAARVAVFLVSAHSLSSKFIRHQEIPQLLDRRGNEGMTFFPVIVKSCVWDEFPWLSQYQVRPFEGRPLAGFEGDKRDAELAKIAKEILSILREEEPPDDREPSIDEEPPDLPDDPPDVEKLTAFAPLHQLPTPPADFTGRAEDLKFLRSGLAQGGTGAIFGLRGMGGIGKTTLALKLAEELKPRFPDAQIYLDLKGVDPQPLTAAQAMGHVIRSFHPQTHLPESEPELSGFYRTALDGKRVLLLMDNAAPDKKQIEPLIPPSTCLLLVTSRFRFALPGLIDRDLDEMPEKDARDLLLRIAPRIGKAVDEIARLCGRLPLALRLAGSALAERPDLSPSEYARRFKGGKEKLERVEASLMTSYDLLTEERRRLWRLLAVFPETFDIKAAAAAWELDPDDAADHMGELVRNSLVEWENSPVEWEEGEGRYRLHDLARAFAHKRIDAVELVEAQRRHAKHFLEVLRSADSLYKTGNQHSRIGLALFDREWSNIRTGQAWAAARFHDHGEAADLCSDYPEEGTYCLGLRLHAREKIQWREIGLAAARHLKAREVEGRHLGNLGIAYKNLGEPRRAIEVYQQRLTIAHEIGDRRGEGNALGGLGIAYADLGDPRRAIELYEQWLPITREIGDRRGEGNALGNLGLAHANLGDPRHAIELYEQWLAITREIGDRRGEGNALGNIGLAHADLGEPRRAIEFYQQHLTIAREIGDRRGEGKALGNLGLAYFALGETRPAIELFEQHLTIAHEIGDRREEGRASWNLGRALEKEGDLARASDLIRVQVDYLREIGHADAEKAAAQAAALRDRIADAARN
jgi:tetratricopeptide (TPR) repeat protein